MPHPEVSNINSFRAVLRRTVVQETGSRLGNKNSFNIIPAGAYRSDERIEIQTDPTASFQLTGFADTVRYSNIDSLQ